MRTLHWRVGGGPSFLWLTLNSLKRSGTVDAVRVPGVGIGCAVYVQQCDAVCLVTSEQLTSDR